jgi:hypothetical protein
VKRPHILLKVCVQRIIPPGKTHKGILPGLFVGLILEVVFRSTQEELSSRPVSVIIFSFVFEITERELNVGDHGDLKPSVAP